MALRDNREIKSRMEDLIRFSFFHDPILNSSKKNSKIFRSILMDLVEGKIRDIDSASQEVRKRIYEDPHVNTTWIGESDIDWPSKVTNLHFSRFYNQAVLSHLITTGQKECYIHHVMNEEMISRCGRKMAGRKFNVIDLFSNLLYKYEYGEKIDGPVIPDNPLCTHVVSPITDHRSDPIMT